MNCPVHGFKMQRIVTPMRLSWFRGDDDDTVEFICPVCKGWKTACSLCGKVMFNADALKQHTRDKHKKGEAA